MKKTILLTALFVLSLTTASFTAEILTGCERSDFSRLTTYPEMIDYIHQLQASSTDMLSGSVGKTIQKRDIPYAVFSKPLVTNGFEASILDRPIIVLTANIHGEEIKLRESLLILMRKLALSGTEENALLEKVVIVAVPSLNPDGFVLNTHTNAVNVNINRDFVKKEQPEMIAYSKNILQQWHPHLYADGHGGGPYPYNLCYQAPSNAACDISLTDLFDKRIVPFIDKKMEASGYKSWYFRIGDRTEWLAGIVDADNGRNYGGFINCVGILYESPASQDLKTGALSGVIGYKALIEYAARNPDELMGVVKKARLKTIELGQNPKDQVPIHVDQVAEDYPVSYEVSVRRNEQGQMEVVKDKGDAIEKITNAKLIKKPIVLKSRPRPYAYLLLPNATQAVDMLKRHNITVETLSEDTLFETQAYKLSEIEYAKKYDRPAAPFIKAEDKVTPIRRKFPKGSYIIRTGQVMGRVVCLMLEPETGDNVITFNALDKQLPKPGKLIPIFKIMEKTPIPAKLSDN